MDKNTILLSNKHLSIITAGSTYLDIDAYGCMVAMAELLNLKGKRATAYSNAPCNYSVCDFLIEEEQVSRELSEGATEEDARYIIVDVSDPDFLKDSVPLDKVDAIYDHHVGFEEYWTSRIGEGAHIEFIGAAATLIYREWQKAGLEEQMSRSTALLLIAAILDNTLDLTSSNTTEEDRAVFCALCAYAKVGEDFRALYFSEVQKSVEADLKNALFGDIKTVRNNAVLPQRVAQICAWNAESILAKLPEIRGWFASENGDWMINVIGLEQKCSYFICDSEEHQKRIEGVFGICFENGIAKTQTPYLRKQIIKKTLNAI